MDNTQNNTTNNTNQTNPVTNPVIPPVTSSASPSLNSSGPTAYTPYQTEPKEHGPVGPVIGLIIILGIILIGGIYFLSTRMNQSAETPNTEVPAAQQETQIIAPETILEQNESDDTDTIEADLNSFNSADIDGLDGDL